MEFSLFSVVVLDLKRLKATCSLWPLHRSAHQAQTHSLHCMVADAKIAHSRIMVDRALQPVHAPRLPTILTSDLGRDSHILSPKQGDFCHLWRSLNLWQRFTLIFVQRFWQSQWRSLTLLERQVSSRHSALLHVLKPEGFYVQLAVPDVEIVFAAVSLSMNTIHPPQSTNVEN